MKGLQSSIIALFVLSFIALIGTAYFYTQVETERKARLEAEKGKGDMERIIQEKEKLIEEKSQNITSLESQLDEMKAEVRTKNQELTKNRTEIAKSESKIKDLSEKIQLLEKENKNLSSKLDGLQPISLSSDSSDFPAEIWGAREGEKNASNAETMAGKGPSSGKIILVNREYRFIVAGVGKLDGVNLKDQIEIIRGDQVIGKAVVSKLYDSISSCEILQEGNSPIQVGDLARVLVKA